MRRWTVATPLFLSGLVFLGVGVWFITSPGALGIIGINAATAAGRGDIRAVYGGLQIAIAVMLLACAYREAWLTTGLTIGTMCFSGLLLGRLYGFALEPTTDTLPWILGAAEAAGVALNGGALAYARVTGKSKKIET